MSARWSRFCVVGPGGHATGKIIPAIEANGQELAGVISRRPGYRMAGCPTFGDIESALQGLPHDTAFILSSPPAAHFAQARLILEAGRDVIVEKPAFVSAREAQEAADLAAVSGSLLVEALMHRYSALYFRFLEYWRGNRSDVRALRIDFLLPGLAAGTFRDESALASSLLFDVGCYVISLLGDLDLEVSDLALSAVDRAGMPAEERYELTGAAGPLAIMAVFGVGTEYRNSVSLSFGDGSATFHPFFYGRAGDRSVDILRGSGSLYERVADGNAFEAMLATPPDTWRQTQAERVRRMVIAARRLEALGHELASHRNGAINL